MKQQFVAEVKTMSPYRGVRTDKTWAELFDIAAEHGDIVSIHTSPAWGGSWEHLYLARNKTSKPILAKGIHCNDDDIMRAFDLGANYVLTVNYIPLTFDPDKIWVELLDTDNLINIPHQTKLVWNSRDLFTGQRKTRCYGLEDLIGRKWVCQASLIATPKDINPKVDAYIVGTNLVEFITQYK